MTKRLVAPLLAGAATGFALRRLYRLLASGALTIDVEAGRRLRPLGPLTQTIAAPPEIVFRLVRGSVPHLVESFLLTPTEGGTEFRWQGELGTDGWRLGEWWGRTVARAWTRAVEESLREIAAEAERRSSRSRRT
jgi:hypothetical protein